MSKSLTDAQRRSYEQAGVLFPIRVLSQDETGRFRTATDELESLFGGKPRTVEVRQMHLHFHWAYELATHPCILDAIEDILGPELLIWATELFSKHPGDAALSIGWHRDRPYMGFASSHIVTAWVALRPSTAANGCMRAFLEPGRRHAIRSPGQSAKPVNDRDVIDVELHEGEMSLHDPDILHGSNPNPSNEKRTGFVIRYLTPDARPLAGKPPVVRARGHDICSDFCLIEPRLESRAEDAVAGMKRSASLHLEAILHNLKVTDAHRASD
jgi:ectoine hydroxylase-related dioxygenase (phytanoyl-CoA dioxygenase family)